MNIFRRLNHYWWWWKLLIFYTKVSYLNPSTAAWCVVGCFGIDLTYSYPFLSQYPSYVWMPFNVYQLFILWNWQSVYLVYGKNCSHMNIYQLQSGNAIMTFHRCHATQANTSLNSIISMLCQSVPKWKFMVI